VSDDRPPRTLEFSWQDEPTALRDHASPERIDRVWSRLERDITTDDDLRVPDALRSPRPRGRWGRPSLALAAGFALGVGVAGWLWRGSAERPVVMQPAPVQNDAPLVFAAGTAPRTYPLPGGGVITLEPGSIVDRVEGPGHELQLRLVRGEATVSTRGATGRERVSLLVGQARVVTAAGSMRIRHDGDTAFLRVIDGSAEVKTPHGDQKGLLLGPDDEARVPVRVVTAQNDPPRSTPRIPGETETDTDDESGTTEESPLDEMDDPTASTPAVVPAWVKACNEYDFAAAVRLFAENGGDLAAVTDPGHLMCLGDGHTARKDGQQAAATYERVVHGTGSDTQRALAALELVRIYQGLGETDKVARYRELHTKLSKGRVHSAEALCQKIQSEAAATRADAVRKLAERYRLQFPNGACIQTIQQLLAQLAAQEEASADDEGDDARGDEDPYEEVAEEEASPGGE